MYYDLLIKCCSSQWRHTGRYGISNHRRLDCLLNRLFRCRSMKTSKLRVTGLSPVDSPHKGPSNAEMFPFDDVIIRLKKPAVVLNGRLSENVMSKNPLIPSRFVNAKCIDTNIDVEKCCPSKMRSFDTCSRSMHFASDYARLLLHNALTHCGLVTTYGLIDHSQYWFR